MSQLASKANFQTLSYQAICVWKKSKIYVDPKGKQKNSRRTAVFQVERATGIEP